MRKKESGITLIALVVTVIILLIITGITININIDKKGIIKESNSAKEQGERESIIQKIEADLYSEKIKTGETPNKNVLIKIITDKGYGTVRDDVLITADGEYEISLSEILNWK